MYLPTTYCTDSETEVWSVSTFLINFTAYLLTLFRNRHRPGKAYHFAIRSIGLSRRHPNVTWLSTENSIPKNTDVEII